MKTRIWAIAVLALLIGGIFFWNRAQAKPSTRQELRANVSEANSNAINEAFNSSATNLRLTLNNLLRADAILGSGAVVSMYNGIDTTRAQQLLMDNANQIASIIQSAYGTNAHDTFLQLWSQQAQAYKNYVTGRKNNDTAKMDQAKEQLQTTAKKMGDLFGNMSSNVSSSTVESLMNQQTMTILQIVDAAAKGDATQTTNLTQQAYNQAGKFADALARGMILDKPDMFQ